MAATRVNSKAEYIGNIMLICNQFKEVRRTVESTDTHWADFMGYENSTSTQLRISGHRKRFPIKVFERILSQQ